MPSNKIIVVLIICVGLVVSSWLISRDTPIIVTDNVPSVFGVAKNEKTDTNDDWRKLLNTANPITQNIISDFSKTSTVPEETTLTGQLTTDLMSEYLLLKQGGREVTEQDISNLTEKILSVPQYTQVSTAKYTEKNLMVVGNSSDVVKKYKFTVGSVINIRLRQIKTDPVMALIEGMNTNDPKKLETIDEVIAVNKAAISDFLAIEVPKQAVKMHLDMLNSFSKILYDLESMRFYFDDPLKGLIGINNYKNHIIEFLTALETMNKYLKS